MHEEIYLCYYFCIVNLYAICICKQAEGLFVEQNMSACYELIAMFVGCISGHVRDICKLKYDFLY